MFNELQLVLSTQIKNNNSLSVSCIPLLIQFILCSIPLPFEPNKFSVCPPASLYNFIRPSLLIRTVPYSGFTTNCVSLSLNKDPFTIQSFCCVINMESSCKIVGFGRSVGGPYLDRSLPHRRRDTIMAL
jgi:hypothetical protein